MPGHMVAKLLRPIHPGEILFELQVDYNLRVAKRTTWLKAEPRVRAHSA